MMVGPLRESSLALPPPPHSLQTYNLPEADVQSYLKQHEPSTIINRHKNSETLKEHPEVKRFLEWRTLHKVLPYYLADYCALAGPFYSFHKYLCFMQGMCTGSTPEDLLTPC